MTGRLRRVRSVLRYTWFSLALALFALTLAVEFGGIAKESLPNWYLAPGQAAPEAVRTLTVTFVCRVARSSAAQACTTTGAPLGHPELACASSVADSWCVDASLLIATSFWIVVALGGLFAMMVCNVRRAALSKLAGRSRFDENLFGSGVQAALMLVWAYGAILHGRSRDFTPSGGPCMKNTPLCLHDVTQSSIEAAVWALFASFFLLAFARTYLMKRIRAAAPLAQDVAERV